MKQIGILALMVLSQFVAACGDDSSSSGPRGKIYVLNQTDGTIFKLNAGRLTLNDSLSAGVVEPHFITFDPDGDFYYVVSFSQNGEIAKFSATRDSLFGKFSATGLFPTAISISPDGLFGYVSDLSTRGDTANMIFKFDLTTLALVDSVPTGAMTHALVTSNDGSFIVAANMSDDVTFIDIATDTAYRVNIDPDSAYLIDEVQYGPFGVVVDSLDSLAYVACLRGPELKVPGQVRVIDIAAKTVIDSIMIPLASLKTPFGPTLMVLSPDNTTLWVTNQWANSVSVINTTSRKVIADVILEVGLAFGITQSGDGSRVYVACANVPGGAGRIYAIDGVTFEKVDSVDVGLNSFGIVWNLD